MKERLLHLIKIYQRMAERERSKFRREMLEEVIVDLETILWEESE